MAATLTRLPYEAWHFGDSIAFEAILDASDILDQPALAGFVRGFTRGWAASRHGFVRLDCTAPGAAMCRVAAEAGDALVLETVIELAGYLTGREKIDGIYATWEAAPLRRPYGPENLPSDEEALLQAPGSGAFLDCLHFDPPFFAALATVTGDAKWIREAAEQAAAYTRVLQDGSTGLFWHFILEKTHHRYGAGWGRGQGWALLGLLDVIERLPAGTDRDTLAASVAALIRAMIDRQRPDGHWDAVVTDSESGVESSTAACMALGFRRALRLGLTVDERTALAADRAHAAVMAALTAGGELKDVSAAVWASTNQTHYSHVPRGFHVPWGQGPVALMLSEAIRARRKDA